MLSGVVTLPYMTILLSDRGGTKIGTVAAGHVRPSGPLPGSDPGEAEHTGRVSRVHG